jgi:hypothetical protein
MEMKTAIKNDALRVLEVKALDAGTKPIVRRCAAQWIDVISGNYSDELTKGLRDQCAQLICDQVEMLYAFWCAARKAHATRMTFEEYVSYEDIGKVEANIFMAVMFEDKLRLVMPCSELPGMTFEACGYEFTLMRNTDNDRIVIGEIHLLQTSL